MSNLASGPADLPWSKNAYLLFNGVTLPYPMRRILAWNQNPLYKPLFLHTRYRALLDKSPVLVQIHGRRDPVYLPFIKHAEAEWGLLMFSDANFQTVLEHLRWLVTVDQPIGPSVLLNLSDPATANALFGLYPVHTDNRLFGPIDELHGADVVQGRWQRHVRDGKAPSHDGSSLYQLNEAQIEALDEVAFRLNLIELEQHMNTFFPDWLPASKARQRFEALHNLASEAYSAGFRTQADIFHYANVSHFLFSAAPGAHPEITDLIRNKSSLTPSQRIQKANWLIVEHERATWGRQA
jgi:hypothetical protein